MIIAYTQPVIEETLSPTYKEAEISSESKMWKDAMMNEMSSLHKNDTENCQSCPRKRKRLVVSGYLQRNKNLQMMILYTTKPDW